MAGRQPAKCRVHNHSDLARRNWRGHADWRAVRVRETVVEPRAISITGTLEYLFGLDAFLAPSAPSRIIVRSEDERRMKIDADRVVEAMRLLGWPHGAVSIGVVDSQYGQYLTTVEL